LQEGLVKRGYWVEVLISLKSNENTQNPGIYLNHTMVAYRAPGKEISTGPDSRAVGFGKSALPAGVSAQPLGNIANMPNPAGMPPVPGAPAGGPYPVPGAPPIPGAAPPAAYPGVPMPGYTPPAMPGAPIPGLPPIPGGAPMPVQPHAGFIAPPVPGAAQAPVPPMPTMQAPPPAAPPPSVVDPLGAPMGYKMANLNGARYDGFKASGWTDATMLQAGHMVRL